MVLEENVFNVMGNGLNHDSISKALDSHGLESICGVRC